MLRKLMKHEFRATGRIMLPLFLILLVTSVGANFSVRGMLETENRFLNVLGVLLVMAFAIAIIGVCVMSMVVMVQRFYKNLLQDEGYVMMTLPVSVHQHIWSKLIVSAVWFALTLVVICLACLIMAFDVDLVHQIAGGFSELFQEIYRNFTAYYAINGTAIVAEFLVMCFVGCYAMCLQFYAALAIGHSCPNHKMAWSVLWFFIIQFVMQFLGGMGIVLLDESWIHHLLLGWTDNISAMASVHLGMVTMILGEVAVGAIFYVLTTWFLKKRLNLE
ncbi:hypothetical protein [Dysosmobacter sp.]|uniref:hypothetical protein n=1 Tax=Dysosmobacter sp. TaxID=2591382 RepID=UPI002A9A2BC0|nr:hypothetical protein [Dysosmobacter sp.]MDY5611623.1 hypothetical protein [Dysosmobacter sp.]